MFRSMFLKKLIDLILYSNLFIACCAVAMTWQTQLLLGHSIGFTPLVGLIFCATLVIYALHRLVGMSKVKEFLEVERYRVIQQYRHHIWAYAGLALLGGTVSFFLVPFSVQIIILIPAVLSLGYVIPFLGKKSLRLRDIDMLKIFLVAGCWAYVTVLLPAAESNMLSSPHIWWMATERSLFVFAITLPFDIRDLKVDGHNQVRTFPAVLGLEKTLSLTGVILMIFSCLVYFNYSDIKIISAMLLSAVSTFIFIWLSPKYRHDYYFTGLMDGTMIIQFLLLMASVHFL